MWPLASDLTSGATWIDFTDFTDGPGPICVVCEICGYAPAPTALRRCARDEIASQCQAGAIHGDDSPIAKEGGLDHGAFALLFSPSANGVAPRARGVVRRLEGVAEA